MGFDEDSFADCMDPEKYDDAISFNRDVGINSGVKGTSSFVVVGPSGLELISGPQQYTVFESAIDSVLGSSIILVIGYSNISSR